MIRTNTPGSGRLRERSDVLIANKGHSHNSSRAALRERGIPKVIPERVDQVAHRGSTPGSTRSATSSNAPSTGSTQYCGLTTRHAERAVIHCGDSVLTTELIWLKRTTGRSLVQRRVDPSGVGLVFG